MAEKGGSVFVTYPMLTKSNYSIWAIKMKALMRAQGVWDAVESTVSGKVDDMMDQKALTAIYQSIPDDVFAFIAEKTTSHEAWEAIKTNRLGDDRIKEARLQTLKSEFERLKMKDTETIDDFALRMTTIANGIRGLGEKFEEISAVKKILRAVPSKFLQIASAIEKFGDFKTMTMEEVTGRLKVHEERLRGYVQDDQDGEQLLLTRSEWRAREHRRDKSKDKCFNCQDLGHHAYECPEKKRGQKKKNLADCNLIQDDEDDPRLF